jgi:hypothetical protein
MTLLSEGLLTSGFYFFFYTIYNEFLHRHYGCKLPIHHRIVLIRVENKCCEFVA